MTETITFSTEEAAPDRNAVFEGQGIPAGVGVTQDIEDLYNTALDVLSDSAAPVAMFAEISKVDFALVYRGEGFNEPSTPVKDISARAEQLALFALTLGKSISEIITERFEAGDFAVASMLDSAASAAADRLAGIVEKRLIELLVSKGLATPSTTVLGYSPGYCGWHMSGQEKLLDFLQPGRIGISLTESFLMQPLKSISGVLVAGPADIHRFANSYPVCALCDTQSCRKRIRALPET